MLLVVSMVRPGSRLLMMKLAPTTRVLSAASAGRQATIARAAARRSAARDGRTLAVLIPISLRKRRSLDSGRPDATGQYPSTTPRTTPGSRPDPCPVLSSPSGDPPLPSGDRLGPADARDHGGHQQELAGPVRCRG